MRIHCNWLRRLYFDGGLTDAWHLNSYVVAREHDVIIPRI
jgi:hypothetical protein